MAIIMPAAFAYYENQIDPMQKMYAHGIVTRDIGMVFIIISIFINREKIRKYATPLRAILKS
jgi:hypothetical protein